MTFLEQLVRQGNYLRNSFETKRKSPLERQKKQLQKLLLKARYTQVAKAYNFEEILGKFNDKENDFFDEFRKNVPIFNYEKIYQEWWHKERELGEKNVAWKGKTKYYALSSGTSSATSKYIPVTNSMIKAITRTGLMQFLSIPDFKDIPAKVFSKEILMLGGSTDLQFRKMGNGSFYEGDLSGITTGNIPFWFQHYYKPGKKIAAHNDWDIKLREITLQASKWDIGYIAGNPAWLQLLMESIVKHYKVQHIHEIWPNLSAFAYGGVSFEPYKKGFEKLLGKPITYIQTYLASEGFVAYQKLPDHDMTLALQGGIFFEFVPFNEQNFDADGEIIGKPKTLLIDEVEENKDYALLMTTCAGAWRYLIGDTVRFTNKKLSEIIISGRTKHFLSLCGEHLSVDNMNKAIELTAEQLNFSVKEFTVAGVTRTDGYFEHQWYIGSDEQVDEQKLKEILDENLKKLNDDYATERKAVLRDVLVKVLPTQKFYDFLASKGKMGGQHKFPRVLKNTQLVDFQEFIK